MSDLPTRPPDVMPCPECGGKWGHVEGCDTAKALAVDWQHARVVALGGRTVRAINVMGREHVQITFTDGVMLHVRWSRIDFSSQRLTAEVQTPEEERAERERQAKGREKLAAMRRTTRG